MKPAILIGFDAFERDKLETMVSEGHLPNLQRIMNQGFYTRLEPKPPGLQAFPWPNLLQGCSAAKHEWYGVKQWRPETMRLETKHPDRLPYPAFWERLEPQRHKIALLDVPFATRPDRNFNGVSLHGWQSHDQFDRYAHPKELWQSLRERFGPSLMRREICAPQSAARLATMRKDMLAVTDQFGQICAELLRQDRWDLFIAVFGTAHRTGHYLWDSSQATTHGLDARERASLESTIDEVYCRCDEAFGRIIDATPSDSRVVAFALHGMRAETGWPEQFPRILGQVKGIGAPPPAGTGRLFRLKQMLPSRLVQEVMHRLPFKAVNAVVPIWSSGMYDWAKVRCFPVPGGDSNSLLRINLKGREAQGTVTPGAEYDGLCQRIETELMSFRDVETGAPVIEKVERVDELIENHDPKRSSLPDLIIHWHPFPASNTTGVTSPKHGEVRWERGWRVSSGRSGDHSPHGWLAAAGPGIPNLRSDETYDIAAVAPTVLSWFGVERDQNPAASAIDELTGALAIQR